MLQVSIFLYLCRPIPFRGEMLEWFKRHAWKACVLQKGTGGSNPFLSAKIKDQLFIRVGFLFLNDSSHSLNTVNKIFYKYPLLYSKNYKGIKISVDNALSLKSQMGSIVLIVSLIIAFLESA